MSGTGAHLSGTVAEALTSGQIPGTFDGARGTFTFTPVRVVKKRGPALVWTLTITFVSADGTPASAEQWGAALDHRPPSPELPAGAHAVLSTVVVSEGKEDTPHEGRVPTEVRAGKNLGKKNATNPWTQALRDGYSLWRKQAARQGSGSAGYSLAEPPPMLVKKVGQTRAVRLDDELVARGAFAQRKFNGVRVVAYAVADTVRGPAAEHPDAVATGVALYSRTSKPYAGAVHIRRALKKVFDGLAGVGVPPAGIRLDGELYLHGKSLEWISGQARSSTDDSSLELQVYDAFRVGADGAINPASAVARQTGLDTIARLFTGPIRRVENIPVTSPAQVEELSRRFLAAGYEGVIVRRSDMPYESSPNNYHSAALFKIKPLHDAEFTIVGFGTGEKGKDKDALMWIAEVPVADAVVPTDRTFRVTPKDMTYPQRRHLHTCLAQVVGEGGLTRFRRDFYGKLLTVEFPSRSAKTGKPEQAKALAVRTYEQGPDDADPMRRLYAECGSA
jgi:hypothetical protein